LTSVPGAQAAHLTPSPAHPQQANHAPIVTDKVTVGGATGAGCGVCVRVLGRGRARASLKNGWSGGWRFCPTENPTPSTKHATTPPLRPPASPSPPRPTPMMRHMPCAAGGSSNPPAGLTARCCFLWVNRRPLLLRLRLRLRDRPPSEGAGEAAAASACRSGRDTYVAGARASSAGAVGEGPGEAGGDQKKSPHHVFGCNSC
jgi:hypothetical protein